MNLERALSFSNKYQKLKQTSPYLICFIVFILCIIIHIPSDLAGNYTPNEQLYVTLRLCYATKFATAPVTQLILIASYVVEGPVLIILAIGSNLLAYVSYKSYMKRKEQLTDNGRSTELTENEKRKIEKKEKMKKKMLIMTICLSIFSIISHLIQFGTQLMVFIFSIYFTPLVLIWARFIFTFIVIFKHFFTIFFYYYFNLNFKSILLSFMCKKDSNNTASNNLPLETRQNERII